MHLIDRARPNKQRRIFVLVVVDHFSKWMDARLIQRKSPEAVEKALIQIFEGWEVKPSRILSDNGTEFKNTIIQSWAEKEGISWEYSSPYHHESVG